MNINESLELIYLNIEVKTVGDTNEQRKNEPYVD